MARQDNERAQSMINVLVQQRNTAQDQIVQMAVQLDDLNAEIADLKAQLEEAKPAKKGKAA